jgi:hypothetical protein
VQFIICSAALAFSCRCRLSSNVRRRDGNRAASRGSLEIQSRQSRPAWGCRQVHSHRVHRCRGTREEPKTGHECSALENSLWVGQFVIPPPCRFCPLRLGRHAAAQRRGRSMFAALRATPSSLGGQAGAQQCRSRHACRTQRRLTPHSSRAPTAKHRARATVHVIICSAGPAFSCRCRLSSNVRLHTNAMPSLRPSARTSTSRSAFSKDGLRPGCRGAAGGGKTVQVACLHICKAMLIQAGTFVGRMVVRP